MTETTIKSAARRLAEIRSLLRLPPASELPAELLPEHLAELMAGCRRTDDRRKFDGEARLIADGIRDKLLTATEKSATIQPPPRKIGFVKSWNHADYGRDPNMLRQSDLVTKRWLVIGRPACVAWLNTINEQPSELVREWLGPLWQEEAPKVGAGKTAPTADSRPGERETYFRTLWLELNQPKPDTVWKELRKRAGKENCPVISTVGNVQFTFQYSTGATEPLAKKVFQNDMGRIRNG